MKHNGVDFGECVRMRLDTRTVRGVAAACAFALAACSKPAPEIRLEQTGNALDEAAIELGDINSQILEAEQRLDELKQQRRKQREAVWSLEDKLENRATDVAIFRAVQKALLEDQRLRESAISVLVEDREVVIAGRVKDAGQKQHAMSVARGVPGVERVRSRLVVDEASDSSPSA